MAIFEAGCVLFGGWVRLGKKRSSNNSCRRAKCFVGLVSYFWKSESCCRCICHIYICLKGDST